MMTYVTEITYWHTLMDKQAFTKASYLAVRKEKTQNVQEEALVSRPICSSI